MDLILYNGKVYSMENKNAIYNAIALKDHIIQAIGSDEDILKLKTSQTKMVNLMGRIVCPGFNDSHMHIMGYGAALSQVDLSAAKSIDDVINITKDFIKTHQIQNNSWVMGRGWNQDNFPKPTLPNHDDLDKISTQHYICLRRACGHVATINTHALNHLDLTTDFTTVDGGEYYDGIFKENAFDLIMDNMPEPTKADMKKWILSGAHALHTFGITSVQSDDLCVFPEHLSGEILEALTELSESNNLPIRVYEQSLFRSTDNLNKFIAAGYQQNQSYGTFTLGPLKILGDGSLGGRTAWIKNGYADADTQGIHMYEQNELDDYVLTAHKHNIATAIHCIGDAMLDSALDSIEKAQVQHPNAKLRHGIVHCQITRHDQFKRMARLGVLAYVQPIFLDYDLHIVYDRVGKQLGDTSYSWKTMNDFGLHVAFGSDAPVETPDPIKGIYCAVTRRDLSGDPKTCYLKDQSFTIYEALYHYSTKGAYTSYEEKIKGKLLPNYYADLVVLNGNIFDDILSTSVDMTIFNGKLVYEKQ